MILDLSKDEGKRQVEALHEIAVPAYLLEEGVAIWINDSLGERDTEHTLRSWNPSSGVMWFCICPRCMGEVMIQGSPGRFCHFCGTPIAPSRFEPWDWQAAAERWKRHPWRELKQRIRDYDCRGDLYREFLIGTQGGKWPWEGY